MNRDQLLNLTLTDLSFKELLALLGRRKWVIIGTMLLFLAGGAAITSVIPATYKASTVVIVEGKTQSNPAGASNVVGAITSSGVDYDVMTQIQIMESFQILYTALKRINYKLPDAITQEVYEKLPKVTVNQIQTTNTVMISVEHTGQRDASELAAAIPEAYSDYIMQNAKSDVKRSGDFIAARIEEERKSFQTLQQEIAQYKVDNNVTDSKTEIEFRSQAVAEAQRRVAEANGDVEASEAAMREAEQTLANAPKTVKNPTVISRNDAMQRNEETLVALKAQREAILVSNYPDSDRVLRLDAQIKAQQAVVDELKKNPEIGAPSEYRNPALDDLESRASLGRGGYRGAIARRDAMKKLFEDRKAELKALAPVSAQQQAKEVKLGEIQTTISKLLDIQSSIQLRDNSLPNPIRDLTGKPTALLVRPIWGVNLILSAFVGLILGTIFALARDLILDRVNSSNEAAIIAGREVLGRIPKRASGRSALIADPQRARAFESYRILRTSLLLAKGDAKAFIVTSSGLKEGKTTVAANLAVALALEGKRTILVEGNLRSPAVHKIFKLDRSRGVSEVLSGTVGVDEALKATEVPNLAVLTAGDEVSNATELIASDAMKTLVDNLKGQADIVLIDSAPAYGYADTQSLVGAVPDVLYIVELQAPTKTQMREAVGMIEFAKGNILGVIINKDLWSETRTRGSA